MGDINELKKKGTKTMAILPGSIKNLNTLLGEQLLDGGGSGGGGSSDFSTATLTLIRGAGARGKLYVSNLMSSPVGTSLFPMLNYIEGTSTHEVVIYSGGTVLNYEGSDTVTVDGNIQDVGNGSYLITGNCTIELANLV